jgi:hypothetical protein
MLNFATILSGGYFCASSPARKILRFRQSEQENDGLCSLSTFRHCERSEAIQCTRMDYFTAFAMTKDVPRMTG